MFENSLCSKIISLGFFFFFVIQLKILFIFVIIIYKFSHVLLCVWHISNHVLLSAVEKDLCRLYRLLFDCNDSVNSTSTNKPTLYSMHKLNLFQNNICTLSAYHYAHMHTHCKSTSGFKPTRLLWLTLHFLLLSNAASQGQHLSLSSVCRSAYRQSSLNPSPSPLWMVRLMINKRELSSGSLSAN